MLDSGVYIIVNLVTGMVYVGSSIHLDARMKQHRCDLLAGRHCNVHLQRSWNKYGSAAFLFWVIEFVSPERVIEREQYYIDLLDAVGSGYNQAPNAGSLAGYSPTEEHRHRVSASVAKYYNENPGERERVARDTRDRWAKMSPDEHRAMGKKIGRATRGRRSPNKGKKSSEKTRRRISAAVKKTWSQMSSDERRTETARRVGGRGHSAETRAKISAAVKKRNADPEVRRRASERMKERWANMTPEERAKTVAAAHAATRAKHAKKAEIR